MKTNDEETFLEYMTLMRKLFETGELTPDKHDCRRTIYPNKGKYLQAAGNLINSMQRRIKYAVPKLIHQVRHLKIYTQFTKMR